MKTKGRQSGTTFVNGYTKKPDFKTKSGKLFLAQQTMTDTESARAIGISPNAVPTLEKTKTYQAIKKSFADTLQDIISTQDIAKALAENITQETDKNARNSAIKIAIDKIEPDKIQAQAQQVNITLK